MGGMREGLKIQMGGEGEGNETAALIEQLC